MITKEEFDQLPILKKIEACETEGRYYQYYMDDKTEVDGFLSLPPEPSGPYFPMPAYVYRLYDFYVLEHNGIYGRRFYTTNTNPFDVLRKNKRAVEKEKFRNQIRIFLSVVGVLYVVIPLLLVMFGMHQHVPSIKDYVFIVLERLDNLLAVVFRFAIKWCYLGFFFLLLISPVVFLFKYIKEDVFGLTN